MKATLEFNLPEDAQDFEQASKATALYVVIEDILRHLKSTIKHENASQDVVNFADKLSLMIHQMLIEERINFL